MAFGEGFRSAERYSGREFEYDLFGQVDVNDPEYRAELAKSGNENGYLPFARAVDLAKKHQPWEDPANPETDYLRELIIAVQEKLGVNPDKEGDALKAYTAVGTPLDRFHGTDAFVTYKDRKGEYVVTLDATRRKDKLEEGHKADVMIGDIPDSEDEEAYLEAIDAVASKIAKRLLERPEDRNEGRRAA